LTDSTGDALIKIDTSDFNFFEEIPLDAHSFNSILDLGLKVTDFSPEWDYCSGGSKVIVCINPPITDY